MRDASCWALLLGNAVAVAVGDGAIADDHGLMDAKSGINFKILGAKKWSSFGWKCLWVPHCFRWNPNMSLLCSLGRCAFDAFHKPRLESSVVATRLDGGTTKTQALKRLAIFGSSLRD